MSQINGFVFIDKPTGMTSHDVVARARRVLGTRRIGHAGTLDPSATGVLILGVGRATRLMSLASDADKRYEATIRLGQSTRSDDADGELIASLDASHLSQLDIHDAMATLTGTIEQVPSAVSAVKVAGQRAHALVRSGADVQLPARKVTVSEFTLTDLRSHDAVVDIDVTVACGSGTYVRALARDLGEALGVGGHVTALRRTESGGVTVAQCQTLADFEQAPQLVPPLTAAGRWVPVVTVADATDLSHGRPIPAPMHCPSAVVAVADTAGQMVALAGCQDGLLRPSVVMVDPSTHRPEDS